MTFVIISKIATYSLYLYHTVTLQIIELPQLYHGGLQVHPFPVLCSFLLLNLMKRSLGQKISFY